MITGKPGTGKTTLIKAAIEKMPTVRMGGFWTSEARVQGKRVGFTLEGFDGQQAVLAHVDIDSPHRVGRYGVDTVGFEAFLDRLSLQNPDIELFVVDEIGKMELFSNRFRRWITEVVNSDRQLLASVALKGEGLVRQIKERPDVHLFEMTLANRVRLLETILA